MELLSRCPEKFHCPVPLETLDFGLIDEIDNNSITLIQNTLHTKEFQVKLDTGK
jgi:hypothetical protein